MSKSKVCLILSAFIYGFAPILAKFAYKSGANGITLTFLRTFLMLPLLFFIMIFRKVSFKLTKKELIDIILLGVVGGSFSMISLYAAYDYINRTCDNAPFYISAYNSNNFGGSVQRKNQEDKTSCGYACYARNVYVC